tara:strand:- start:285 stop:827 length:543 start_codon:yes stop_codon:yes gene_type:complete
MTLTVNTRPLNMDEKNSKATAKKRKAAIICDIDGTVALMKGKRGPFEYEKAFEDEPNMPVIYMLLAARKYYEEMNDINVSIIFVSARENIDLEGRFADVEHLTIQWVMKYVVDAFEDDNVFFKFRKAGDHRKDAFVKFEIGKEIMKDYNILCVFDDRNQVVDMWRNGLQLTCFQVADGNF